MILEEIDLEHLKIGNPCIVYQYKGSGSCNPFYFRLSDQELTILIKEFIICINSTINLHVLEQIPVNR